MLVRTIVVAGDGARADIDVIANLRIAQIGQMTRLGAFPETRFFHFHEVTNVGAFQQFGARAQTGKWTDGAGCLQLGIFHHAVGANFAVIADGAVFDHAAGADFHSIAQHHVAFHNNVSIDLYIAPVLQRTAQIETRRIAQHHARQQQLFRLLRLVDALQARKLQAVVDAFDFAQALRMHCDDLVSFLVRHGDDIGDVVFALSVVIGEFRQPAL